MGRPPGRAETAGSGGCDRPEGSHCVCAAVEASTHGLCISHQSKEGPVSLGVHRADRCLLMRPLSGRRRCSQPSRLRTWLALTRRLRDERATCLRLSYWYGRQATRRHLRKSVAEMDRPPMSHAGVGGAGVPCPAVGPGRHRKGDRERTAVAMARVFFMGLGEIQGDRVHLWTWRRFLLLEVGGRNSN